MAKIIVIEDDNNEREIIRRFLENNGHVVACFPDGNIEMSLIVRTRPDLIILDVIMPGVDGWTLGCKIKNNSALCDIPIIMLTGYTKSPFVAWNIAADLFIPKPFKGEEFVGHVNRLLACGNSKPERKIKAKGRLLWSRVAK